MENWLVDFLLDCRFSSSLNSKSRVHVPKFSKQLDFPIPATTVVSERSALNPMLKSDLVISRGVTIHFFYFGKLP